jgi:hypothetical protein
VNAKRLGVAAGTELEMPDESAGATIWPEPLKSRYPITADSGDVVDVVPVVVVVVPVPVVVPVLVVVVPVDVLCVCIAVGFRTKPYNPVSVESEHPF